METLCFLVSAAVSGYKAHCYQASEKRKITGRSGEKTQENESVDYQVLVVGGGPAGATASYYLGKNGIQVLLQVLSVHLIFRHSSKDIFLGCLV